MQQLNERLVLVDLAGKTKLLLDVSSHGEYAFLADYISKTQRNVPKYVRLFSYFAFASILCSVSLLFFPYLTRYAQDHC